VQLLLDLQHGQTCTAIELMHGAQVIPAQTIAAAAAASAYM
jgi:hypothetical protein